MRPPCPNNDHECHTRTRPYGSNCDCEQPYSQEIERITEQIVILHNGRLLALGNLHAIRDKLDQIPHRITIEAEDAKALAKDVIDMDEVYGISFPDKKNLSIQTHNLGAIHSNLPAAIVENGHRIHTIDNPDDDLASILGYLTSGGGM